MTVGIYKLNFDNTDKVYIGQSVNIEKRFKEHLNLLSKGLGKHKLQEAYNTYGKPSLEILIDDVSENELNTYEIEAINLYDSVNNGFNTLAYPGNPDIRGHQSVHAKLHKDTYVKIFELLANTDMSLKQISEKVGCTRDIVQKIFVGTTHSWLYEEYQALAELVINKRQLGRYYRKSHSESDRKIRCPLGAVFTIVNIREFCREHELNSAHISAVLRGVRKSHKGWKKV